MIISAPNERRFGGISRLYGPAALQRFSQAHVCVVGVGGVGSWAVEALARSGIGRLTLIDLDNVAESNTNRQLHALTDNFGLPKVTALHRRILQINPACTVHEIEDFVDAENVQTLFAEPFDFVIDAIDQVRVKAAMAAHFVAKARPRPHPPRRPRPHHPRPAAFQPALHPAPPPRLSARSERAHESELHLFRRKRHPAANRRRLRNRCRTARIVLRRLRREYAGYRRLRPVLRTGSNRTLGRTS